MLEKANEGLNLRKLFFMNYEHPNTNNGCPNIGRYEERAFVAKDRRAAMVLVENLPVICVNSSCGVSYKLKK